MGYGMSSSPMTGPTGKTGNVIPKGYKQGQVQNFSPEMMQLFQSLFSHVSPDSFLSRLAGGDQSTFDEMEAPAMRQFGQLQGSIADRFSNAGMGSRRSSGHNIAQNQAASDFAQDLQSKRQQYQMDAIKQLMGLSGDLLSQKPYENFLVEKPKKSNFLEQLLGGISGGVGQIGSLAAGKQFGLF